MALYAIGDFHLSLSSNKPMDIFGPVWDNHTEKLETAFSALTAEDVTVICGDISWAMDIDGAVPDFKFIDRLPGKKIILKGNHDYWWSTVSKARKIFEKNDIKTIDILHNNYFPYNENVAICGTRGWFFEEETGSSHDRKIMERELVRLESSLKAAENRDKYVFLHYPPKYSSYECEEILALLEAYRVKACYSGHIHGKGLRFVFEGEHRGTLHKMVSADYVNFIPQKVLD